MSIPEADAPVAADKPERQIFVIMPFRGTPSRNLQQLTTFFYNNIKQPIEQCADLLFRYRVRRSEDEFNITTQIITDLYFADIVICDLSGTHGNPNVMYELGVRLTCSPKPVILIREANAQNEPIFDISGFYTHSYDPLDYSSLTSYILEKMRKLESGEEIFRSPVLNVLEDHIPPVLRTGRNNAANLLNVLELAFFSGMQATIRRVNDHLAVLGRPPITTNVFDISKEFEARLPELRTVDWSDLRIIVAPHPALIHYISTQYLIGVVDYSAEIAFSLEILRHHSAYFAEATWWLDINLDQISSFLRESQLMAFRCRAMAQLLRARTDEEYEHWWTSFWSLMPNQSAQLGTPPVNR